MPAAFFLVNKSIEMKNQNEQVVTSDTVSCRCSLRWQQEVRTRAAKLTVLSKVLDAQVTEWL